MAAELTFHLQRDQAKSLEIRKAANADVDRVHAAAQRIKNMTRIYQERLEGKRTLHDER